MKNTKIYQLQKLLESSKFTKKEVVNKLVGSSGVTALIESLRKKGHQITTIRDFDEVHGYEYNGYIVPFYLIARAIERDYPELEKHIRALYTNKTKTWTL